MFIKSFITQKQIPRSWWSYIECGYENWCFHPESNQIEVCQYNRNYYRSQNQHHCGLRQGCCDEKGINCGERDYMGAYREKRIFLWNGSAYWEKCWGDQKEGEKILSRKFPEIPFKKLIKLKIYFKMTVKTVLFMTVIMIVKKGLIFVEKSINIIF